MNVYIVSDAALLAPEGLTDKEHVHKTLKAAALDGVSYPFLDQDHIPKIEEQLELLIRQASSYDANLDISLLRRAFQYALDKHAGQARRSGEPYIFHPLAVGLILTELQMGAEVLAAALLHDVVEDCAVSREEIAHHFGEEIAQLVDGVTKLKLADFEARLTSGAIAKESNLMSDSAPGTPHSDSTVKKHHHEISRSAANLRKILLAMARGPARHDHQAR